MIFHIREREKGLNSLQIFKILKYLQRVAAVVSACFIYLTESSFFFLCTFRNDYLSETEAAVAKEHWATTSANHGFMLPPIFVFWYLFGNQILAMVLVIISFDFVFGFQKLLTGWHNEFSSWSCSNLQCAYFICQFSWWRSIERTQNKFHWRVSTDLNIHKLKLRKKGASVKESRVVKKTMWDFDTLCLVHNVVVIMLASSLKEFLEASKTKTWTT